MSEAEPAELVSCPFCGDVLIEIAGNEWEEDFKAKCIGCLASSGRYRTRPEAIRAWNTRASSAPTAREAAREIADNDQHST